MAIALTPDRAAIASGGDDLSFVTVSVVDSVGTVVPNADNLVEFSVSGPGVIAGVDNGQQTSHESFKGSHRKAFNGLCLAVIRSTDENGAITLTARSKGLRDSTVILLTK